MSLFGETLPPDTVIVAVAETEPAMLAMMLADPAETAVTSPLELTVAIAEAFEVHVTIVVTFCVLDGCFPWPMIPVAVSCAVCPALRAWLVGVISMVPTSVLLPHPANNRPAPNVAHIAQRLTHSSLRRRPTPACSRSSLKPIAFLFLNQHADRHSGRFVF